MPRSALGHEQIEEHKSARPPTSKQSSKPENTINGGGGGELRRGRLSLGRSHDEKSRSEHTSTSSARRNSDTQHTSTHCIEGTHSRTRVRNVRFVCARAANNLAHDFVARAISIASMRSQHSTPYASSSACALKPLPFLMLLPLPPTPPQRNLMASWDRGNTADACSRCIRVYKHSDIIYTCVE